MQAEKIKLREQELAIPQHTLTILSVCCLFLSACSSPADVSDMVYTVPESKKAAKSSKYFKNITVDKVTGGGDTEFYHDAKIGNAELKTAIEQSLKSANMLADSSDSVYHLTVELLELKQQSFGDRPNTDIHVKFILKNKKTNVNVFADAYHHDEFATNEDALRRGKKVEIATERAAKGVIHKLLDRLLM